MPFEYNQKILLKYCDPAGIVFYPRYFEMINDCVEDFFDRVLQWPFEMLLNTGGVPTVSTTTEFQAPSRHGDQLVLELSVKNLGTSSLTLTISAHSDNDLRFSNTTTLVCVNNQGRPTAWPDPVRTILTTKTTKHYDS